MMYIEQDINSISKIKGEITDKDVRHLTLLNDAYQNGILDEESNVNKAKSEVPVEKYHEDFL